ncbi:NADH-quinone oxidoreductase subunit NuoE [Candidatus Formimonas warabiya]|uniref:NAD(P)H-dependent oxidoreductase subunit E n=1 Tax=Formimonas warabiya TaxID=1761012 RepID=A0A3G1KNJ0_FORW1|nr:NADH-quinone oxidoreductase subunit NuoE [Candidatus Formimonas warabiya]ATW24034.1 NAD(P)H-dependent oxidoreductase subunit E [Candidatus Formimonas warabiya]
MQCCCGEEKKLENRFPDSDVDLQPLNAVLEKYKGIPGSLITILQQAQGIYGYLPRKALAHIADVIGVKPAKVLGAATFYTQFRFKPIGKYLVMLCQGTACHVNGSEKIEYALCDELNIKDGETTPDNLFTLENVACLGCCSLAPVMMINGEAYGKLTPDSARKVIREIYKKETNS